MPALDRLHIGCGDQYLEGFVNLDRGAVRVDVEHDLEDLPYPFEDDRFSLIIANQTLEHLDRDRWLDIVAELHRISAPNAVWEFRSPYALSDNFATDPTHRMPLAPRSFDYFDRSKPHGRLGEIYGFGVELRVLTGELVPADDYGPDVYHRLLVVKPGTPVRVPQELPAYLYTPESWARRRARRVIYSSERAGRVWRRVKPGS